MIKINNIPNTPTIGISYMRDGVKYECVIKNPGTSEGIRMALVDKNIGWSQHEATGLPIKAIKPTIPVQRTYAQHLAAEYQRAMESR